MGDWGDRGRLRRISSPCLGMKKLISKRFKTYLIGEYNTSKYFIEKTKDGKLNERKLSKMKATINYKKDDKDYSYNRDIHTILTCEKGDKKCMYMNRDYNACQNMCTILESLIKTKERPKIFTYKSNEV